MRARIASALRGVVASYASVLFSGDLACGALFAAATFVVPGYGLAGLAAVVAANGVAALLGYRADAIRGGYYGYNALLVGLAAAGHHACDARLVALVALAGALTALATAVLGDLLGRGAALPVLALPFVVLATALVPALHALPAAGPTWLDRPIVVLAAPPAFDGILHELGAIAFLPVPLVGVLVLAALVRSSRIAAALALVGLVCAHGMARALGVADPATALAMAYNAAFVAIALGAASFVPGRASVACAVAGALAAAWLSASASAVLGPFGIGVLAWPFVLVALPAIRALHLRAPDRAPHPSPLPAATPEANLAFAAARAARFGIPGPPQLALPFADAWTVTQGEHGAHTHQGAWAHALDFEVVDDRGFPFTGEGAALDDYRCFGLPVLAPASGTVAAVHDGADDCAPGVPDTARPWGNAIVIQCGPELYAVVAHLRRGSIAVAPGQWVAAGQPIAACGSSGRSPRPHLHLQLQRTPALGAPTVPFVLAHYLVHDGARRRYVARGLPREGERLARPAPSARVDAFAALPPGLELALDTDRGRVRLASEVSLLGERSLRDLDRGDRLYFTSDASGLVFTTHTGPADAPLRALLLAVPRLPSISGNAELDDSLPASALLSRPARLLHDLLRFLADPISARASIRLEDHATTLTIHTTTSLSLLGRPTCRTHARATLSPTGLTSLSLSDATGRPRLEAHSAP